MNQLTVSTHTSRAARVLLLTCCSAFVACGGGGGGDAIDPPPGEPVKIALVESTPAPPAIVGDECVVFTEIPSDEEVYRYTQGRVPDIFEQIGASVRQCMDGEAQPYLSQVPERQLFFRDTLYINLDGSCPPNSSGCYYPNNPTIDLLQTVLSLIPAIARIQLDRLLGHEIWHAVAGSFHPV